MTRLTARTGSLAVSLAVAAALLLAGCGGGGGGGRLTAPPRGNQDINPHDPATLRDGGDLRIPLDNLPTNYNYNTIDGHEDQTSEVLAALIPRVFTDAPDGGVTLNTDYVSAAELVSPSPQVVRYHINDRAVWSSGRPITWEDFAAQVSANNGSNTAFQIADKTGYQDIAKVERGATDKDVLITFGKPYAEWQGLFYGLYPKETDGTPEAFNTGWISQPRLTAGPFKVGTVDQTAKTITLVRNERWWGDRPRLNRVIFTVTDRNALADRLANNEIDLYEIGSSIDLFRRAQGIPGVQVRQATPKQFSHITFNGAPGALLSDLRLRTAIAKGIDRAAIARRLIGGIVPTVAPMGNHIYAVGSKDYRDNSDVLPYDQAAANRELDALGWVRPSPGAVRARNGQPLRLRFVVPAGNPISDAISRTTLDQLAQIGVQIEIDAVPTGQFFSNFVNVGNFDLTGFQWIQTSVPFSNSVGNYQETKGTDIGNNFGRIYDPRIGPLFAQGLAELNEAKRAEIGNQVDRLIWEEVHDVPLYPQTGAFAVRATVANFGAGGLGDWDFEHAGFTQ
jgi:peptide/nickel transport system substrate-binding protein